MVDWIAAESILDVCCKVEAACGEVDVCCNVTHVEVPGCDFEPPVPICLTIVHECVSSGLNSLTASVLDGEPPSHSGGEWGEGVSMGVFVMLVALCDIGV